MKMLGGIFFIAVAIFGIVYTLYVSIKESDKEYIGYACIFLLCFVLIWLGSAMLIY